ncbi:MAG TPA: hypothetical protein VGY56_20855 [Verrucomicrobiae bacterium]|nr:hypothetical protein [Verrucomicrobiae bacterium]
MSSIRNTVVVALLQVGVMVVAVLAAGICHRVWATSGMALPTPVSLLYNYGVAGLLIPLAWAAGATALQIRSGVSDDLRVLMFWLGVVILIALAIFAVYADVSPWLTFPDPGGGDAGGGD